MRTTGLPASTDTSTSFIKRLAVALLLLNLFVYALAAFSLYQSWQQYKARVEIATQNLAGVLESNIVGIMGKSTVALLAVVDEAERYLAAGGIDEQPFNDFVLRQKDRVPELERIRITDSQGDILYGDNIDPAPLVNLADRDYFQYLRENPQAGTHISKPYISRVSNNWSFNLGHRINNPDGSFAGVALAVFPIKFFTTSFASLDIGRDGVIDLRYEDLSVVARFPEPEGFGSTVGKVNTLQEYVDRVQAGSPGATFAGRSKIDNVYRIFTYRKLPDFPFYIRVGESRAAIFDGFSNDILALAAQVLFFSLVTIWLARQLAHQWRKEQQAAADLRTTNQELEQRVAERTAALRASNEQLQVEIAGHEQLEIILRQSEQRYRRLAENISDVVWTMDFDYHFTDVTPSIIQLLGISPEESLQRSPLDDLPTASRQQVEALIAAIGAPDEIERLPRHWSHTLELENRHKDGRLIPVEVRLSLLYDEQDRPIEILGVTRDITERKQAEASLRASEIRYRTLFENSDDGILLTVPDGRILSANPAACLMFGRTEAEIRAGGRNLLIDVNDPRLPAALEERARTGRLHAELTHLRRDGSRFPAEVSSTMFYGENGETLTSMTVRDITERVRLQDELRVSLEKYRVLFESFPMGIAITDDAGTIVEINSAAEQLLAVPRDAYTGRTIDGAEWRIIRRDGTPMPPAEYASVRALQEQRMVENVEMGIVKGPGDIAWISVTAAPIPLPGYGVAIAYSDIGDRIRAEEALRESEHTLRVLIDATQDSILLLEPDGVVVVVNETAAARLHRTPMTLAGCSAFDMLPPAVAAFRRRQVQNVARTGKPAHFEDERFGRWIDNSFYPVHNTQGQITRVAAFGRDVTERKQMEEELRKSEASYRALVRNFPDGAVLLFDREMRYLIADGTSLRQTGFVPESIVGRTLAEVRADSPNLQHLTEIYRAILDGKTIEEEFLSGDKIYTLTGVPLVDDKERVYAGMIITQDITERKQLEEELRESERRTATILRMSPIVIGVSTVAEGRYTDVNDAFEQMLGYSRAETIGRTSSELNLWVDDDTRANVLREIQAHGRVENLEIRLRRKSGDVFPALMFMTPIVLHDEPLLLAMVMDITVRKQAEANAASAKDAAEAANRAKGEFLANMSHELRTPLNAILGFSDLMIRDGSLSPDQKENLSIINRSGEYLLGLINDVLDMAKIEAGRVTLQERDFDLRHMIDDLMTLVQIRAAAKGLALSMTVDPSIPKWIYADEGKLRQVLINLVGNAVKFTATGSVELAVRPVETADGPRLLFAVRDTGPGIAADDLVTIFEPFVQKLSAHSVQEGTGLGLPAALSV